ncbi:ABC transporter substrate-binding protein [Blastochloris viridis]|uniref:Ferrichrome/ferrioxamine B periplasmic transporter n=1 Tax=Blastochloris viridis TaxID=1079 RepID=A0A0H5BDF5_BLAVI|nr:ABC transporter substrate-binding protein [Blastochloris viridis]ALK10893.1 corrinoid ABC transporter substrate-binding protein [Blastochloris viridis]BAR99129.1 putative periplasmic substrate-binding transport protein [Blastochloris viridis]CUU43555.1 ferrichrome/ferrioxamine B periplasmic transporter [Blastochloris viridis]
MSIDRRAFVASALAACACGPCVRAVAADMITVTDVAGRTVAVPRPVRRIVLGEGRHLLAMALVHPDPVSLLAGWPADLKRQDTVTYGLYRDKFPAIDAVPIIGHGTAESFSVEQALASEPDLAIFSGGYGPSARSQETIDRFEAAGVPVVFLDFMTDPLKNTLPSMALLGRLLGREAQADAYVAFCRSRLERVRTRLAEATPPIPTVLMHAHAGFQDCCNSPGRATLGAFIAAAGGHNIAADVLKQPIGPVSLEYVLERDPEVYVATGGTHLAGTGGLVIGPGVDAAQTRALLAALARRPGIAEINAVKHGRVHGLWHLLGNMALNTLAVEVLAKWFHPTLFGDVDPDASLREINTRFLPVPFLGTFWASA